MASAPPKAAASPAQAATGPKATGRAQRLGLRRAPRVPAPKPPSHGLAIGSALMLVAAVGALLFALPGGLRFGGQALDTPMQAVLLGGALVAGLWGAFSARDGRVLLGFLVAAALLAPAYDPRAPLDRMVLYVVAAVLFVLAAEFGLLHAKVARLAAMPRAHVTQVGKAREVELSATAGRIAGSWPAPLAAALGILGLAVGLQLALGAVAPPALGESVELRGPFGVALAGVVVLGALAAWAVRRSRPTPAAAAPQGARGSRSSPGAGPGAPGAASGSPASAPGGAPPAAPPGPR